MTEEDFDNDNFEDEFDFVEDDDLSANKNSSNNNTQKSHDPKRILIVVAAVAVLIGGYFLYGMLSGPSEPATADTTAQVTPEEQSLEEAVAVAVAAASADQAAAQTAQTGATIDDMAIDFQEFQQPMPTPNSTKTFEQVQRDLQSSKTQIPAEINATLDSISEEMTLNVNQIKQLDVTITTLANTVDQLSRTISAMDNRILGLTETVDALAQDLTNVKRTIIDEDLDLTAPATVKFSNKQEQKTLNTSAAAYTVHAIIPGRAWLKSSGGQILTVREGDKVGDFGTVAVIDAANGLVRTSSGITFR